MGWLRSGPERKDVTSLLDILTGNSVGPEYPGVNFLSHVRNGWDRNELVFACITERATSVPQGTLRPYDALGRRGEPLQAHPLRRLLANPNPLISEYDLFELLILHLDLAGNAFWEKVRDRAGNVVELWPLRPDKIRMVRSKRDVSYRYVVAGGSRSVPVDVVHFRYTNPADPLVGCPPMASALRAVSLDNEATDFVKTLLQNHAIPGVIVKMADIGEVLDDAVTERLKAKWEQSYGGRNRGKPAFLQTGMDVQELGLNLKDLEFPDLRDVSETRICSVFRVPPMVVGAKVGLEHSTFSNMKEARRAMWEGAILNLQRRIRDTIAAQLLPDLSVGSGTRGFRQVSLRWDNSEVDALRESEADRWNRATEAFRAGGLTVNDYRREIGQPDVDGGDVFLMPSGVVATRDMDGAVESLNGRRASLDPGAKQVAAPERKRAQTLRERAEKDHESALTAFYAAAREDVVKALSAKASLPAQQWREDLADRLYKAGYAASKRAALSVLAAFDAERIEAWHYARAQGLAQEIADSLNEASREALVAAEPSEAVNHLFQVKRDTVAVAATQMATATIAWGKREAGKQAAEAGRSATKTWNTGPNPRSEHAQMDGETVGINAAFSNGMQYPGDNIGDVGQVAGCNCSVTINIED